MKTSQEIENPPGIPHARNLRCLLESSAVPDRGWSGTPSTSCRPSNPSALPWVASGVCLSVPARPESSLCLQVQPDIRIDSPWLSRVLFEVFLGSSSVVPEARKEWANGARLLLESEQVRRASRKGGSG
jgi:hypothetical protein